MNLGHDYLSLAAGLTRADARLDTVSARVSSGRRIDRPAADSAGVGQVAHLDSEQTRLRAAEVNVQNGVSRLQATDSQLSVMGKIVTRLSELASLATGPAQVSSDRAQYAAEFGQLQSQLRQIVGGSATEIGGAGVNEPLGRFNDRELFGSGPADRLAIGAESADSLALPVINLRQGAVGALIKQDSAGNFTQSLAAGDSAALGETLRAALAQIGDSRALVGAGQSRLGLAAGMLATADANREAALGSIQDADLAAETTEMARLKILSEGHTAMLVQARDVTAKLLPLLARN